MNGLDIWMRENPLVYVWLGSYALAFMIWLVEIVLVRRRRTGTLRQIRLLRDSTLEEKKESAQ